MQRIAADTGYFGDPIEALMEDRNLFLDFFYRYYIDFEPEHLLIACVGSEVAGFLTGCTDTRRQRKLLGLKILPGVFLGLLTGRYRFGPKARRYVREMGKVALSGEHTEPDVESYPAHLHINVAETWRGHGLGRKLMSAYLDQLRALGLPGVHLETTDRNEVACRMYERFGFQLVAARSSDLWRFALGGPVEMRCYGLKL